MVLVGKSSLRTFEKRLQDDASIKLKKVLLYLVNTKVFTQNPFFYIVYREDTIEQLVFYSNHLSRFLYGGRLKEGIYSDLIWNTAASLACVEVPSVDSFSTFAASTGISPDGWANLTAQEKRQVVLASQENPGTRIRNQANREENLASLVVAHEANRALGYRGLAAYREAIQDRDPRALASLARRGQTYARNRRNLRLNRLHAVLNSKEVVEFLAQPASFYTLDVLREIHDRIAEYHGWPIRWADIAARAKGLYRVSLQTWHEKLETWKQSDTAFTELIQDRQNLYLQCMAVWYDVEKAPNGLRYIRDNGPEMPETQDTPSAFNPAIMLFWHRSGMNIQRRNEFKDMIHQPKGNPGEEANEE